jgi:hypothetical protein
MKITAAADRDPDPHRFGLKSMQIGNTVTVFSPQKSSSRLGKSSIQMLTFIIVPLTVFINIDYNLELDASLWISIRKAVFIKKSSSMFRLQR